MPTTLAIRFPLGRYHATPWDRSVNEGATEWPPPPWRLLRALISTWHTRWPDLPAEVLDGLLEALGDPPSYQSPPVRAGHTRHYLPDLSHRKGESGRTDLTLDPFLWLRPGAPLLVQWDVDLGGEQRAALAKLAELLPYLGRAESVCEARLLDEDPEPDETWWRPGGVGTEGVRLLAPVRPISRSVLERSTVEVRKARRSMPPNTRWVEYARTAPSEKRAEKPRLEGVQAVRFSVVSHAPVLVRRGVLLADAAHRTAARKFPADGARHVLGYKGAATDHRHAHWIPLSDPTGTGREVQSLVVYVPAGLSAEDVAKLISIGTVAGKLTGTGGDGYDVKGLPEVRLLLQGVGAVAAVAPELCGPSRRWRSLTPYLPVRHWHYKRESLDDYVSTDVGAELAYREMPKASVTRVEPADGLPDLWARGFRRYRMREHLGNARPGLGLTVEFSADVAGPLLLGQLSHFGYGIFIPE